MNKDIAIYDTENDILICDCNSTEHQLVIFKDKEYKEVFIQIHLIKRSLWKRLKYGVKYIFGYKSRFGAWDEFIFNPKDIPKLEDIIKALK